MHPRRVYAKNMNARNANTLPSILDQDVLNPYFHSAIKLLDQSVTNKNNHKASIPTNANVGSGTVWVYDFNSSI